MAGRGGVNKHKQQWNGVVPLECSFDTSKIFRLSSHLQWEVAREPIHHDIGTNKTSGVGLAMSFANAVKERVGVIGLVPCAVGGSAIKDWARGTELYESMVQRAKAAAAHGGGGEIKAVLWYQGESETRSQERVDCYKENVETLIHNVREDLDLPSLPIVMVAIASGDEKNVEKIREIQKGINLPNVVCVDSKGLQLAEDNLHLTTEAQVHLGRIVAEAYLTHFLN
ncbi:hypothetical protein BUALT_Bualt19G0107100 [Buddleja alternifolia]|uniref:Sialate O-acetylesterase domain-containing protein n=1 Tax=Buddleja alternifolia TaxID=168488 RepID=A0AAV6W6H2_9LAMI|nr:hypothetical protein BUALT_Bualt19G0107100 [Buddleja alternifolia]